jgi:hypothetical protein
MNETSPRQTRGCDLNSDRASDWHGRVIPRAAFSAPVRTGRPPIHVTFGRCQQPFTSRRFSAPRVGIDGMSPGVSSHHAPKRFRRNTPGATTTAARPMVSKIGADPAPNDCAGTRATRANGVRLTGHFGAPRSCERNATEIGPNPIAVPVRGTSAYASTATGGLWRAAPARLCWCGDALVPAARGSKMRASFPHSSGSDGFRLRHLAGVGVFDHCQCASTRVRKPRNP